MYKNSRLNKIHIEKHGVRSTEDLIIGELIDYNLHSSIQKIEDTMLILLMYVDNTRVSRVSPIAKAIHKDLRSEFPIQVLRSRLRTWPTLHKSLSDTQAASMLEELEDLRNDTTFCS